MYDNLDTAKQKLHGTMCYYGDRAVYVKEVKQAYVDAEKGLAGGMKTVCWIQYIDGTRSAAFSVDLTDPKFQFMRFNIGYFNFDGYAIWYYRIPQKQWKQGLHANQLGVRDKSQLADLHEYCNFGANEYAAAMMENRYPVFQEAVEMLGRPSIKKVAFNKDFAAYKDPFRGDLMIEHKGNPVAFGDIHNVFKCAPDRRYLRESLQELNIKVA